MIVFSLPGTDAFSSLAGRLGAASGTVEVHRFPDEEVRVRLVGPVSGEDVVLVARLDHPDRSMFPMLFAAATAHQLGAASVGLVAPYLPYLRQDRCFRPGEGVSARYFAELLARATEWLVTVDPHLHRIATLGELFGSRAEAVPSAPLLAAWVRQHVAAPLIVGPDVESTQWVAAVAQLADAPYTVAAKRRQGDRRVEVKLPDLALHGGRQPVLMDDIISSGATMAAAVGALREAGWPAPICLIVHAIFAPGAEDAILSAGASAIVSCNTVEHPSNAIDVGPLLAEAVSRRLGRLVGRPA